VADLTVSVADVLDRPGQYRDVALSARLAGVRSPLVSVAEAPLEAHLRLESVIEGVLVTGAVEAPTVTVCARCLSEQPGRVALDVCELFAPARPSEPEESYPLAGTEIDLEPMLRDAVALALPLRPLCRPECRGLCASCGADLNLGPCDCKQDDVDPRWAALGALRERLFS
jgi:uncharacterized protein